MLTEIIFVVSGLAIVLLISAKMWEERRKSSFFLLRGISRGDERIRTLTHATSEGYTMIKEKGGVFVKNELPLHVKGFVMKADTFIKERADEFIGNVRGSRFLKKNDGISEFFKSISEKENEGRIDDTLENPAEDSQEK